MGARYHPWLLPGCRSLSSFSVRLSSRTACLQRCGHVLSLCRLPGPPRVWVKALATQTDGAEMPSQTCSSPSVLAVFLTVVHSMEDPTSVTCVQPSPDFQMRSLDKTHSEYRRLPGRCLTGHKYWGNLCSVGGIRVRLYGHEHMWRYKHIRKLMALRKAGRCSLDVLSGGMWWLYRRTVLGAA